ncbi:hypothetical protein JCM3774_004199 [Rhodotorula dairenensis]
MKAPLWSLPASERPPWRSVSSLLWTLPFTLGFICVFDVGIIATVLLLAFLFPLYCCTRSTRRTYRQLGKRAFGRLLVVVVNAFSPTELVLSAGRGIDSERWIERDRDGKLVGLHLPEKALWISNHTTLTDWIYLWILAYLSDDHSASLFISLKNSLRRIPIIGSACQLFGFIFMARKWATDKEPFAKQLDEIAHENEEPGKQMALLLFPEGTIVTANTRGISKKFADQSHISDFKHLLLPRSTGLFFALRRFAQTTPSLKLVDITVGYPLPRSSPSSESPYASDYYTLPSVLLWHVPPPELHMHLRAFELSEIPLGKLGAGEEGTDEEKHAFGEWLYERWAEKDALMERFRTQGTFVAPLVDEAVPRRANGRPDAPVGLARSRKPFITDDSDDDDDDRPAEYRWPVALRQPVWELFAAFQFGWPLVVAGLLWMYRWSLMAGTVSIFSSALSGHGGDRQDGQLRSSSSDL